MAASAAFFDRGASGAATALEAAAARKRAMAEIRRRAFIG
jgi:hypothetical protein